MGKISSLLGSVLVCSALVSCSPQKTPQVAELVVTAMPGDWAELPKRVTGILLEEELGYEVLIRESSPDTVFASMANGETDIFTDVWVPNQQSYIDEYVPDKVKIAGDLSQPSSGIYTEAEQGWVIPRWTRETYRIDSLEDLAALEPGDELFDALDIDDDGLMDLIGGEVGWSATDLFNSILDAYNESHDLDMKQIMASLPGGHDEMFSELVKGKLAAREDVLFYYWTPGSLSVEYPDALLDDDSKILWLADPWGAYSVLPGEDDAATFSSSTIYIAYRSGLEEENPVLVQLLERIYFPIEDLNDYCYWSNIVNDGHTTTAEKNAYARQWIADHQTEIDRWLAHR